MPLPVLGTSASLFKIQTHTFIYSTNIGRYGISPGCRIFLSLLTSLTTHPSTELESKYTQFVSCHSRPVWPRVDLGPLARLLNRMEGDGG